MMTSTLTLINAIDKKTLTIYGREYLVYEPVTAGKSHLSVCFGSKSYRVGISKNTQESIDQINRYVEMHYQGDRLNKARVDSKATHFVSAKGYISVSYSHHCPKDMVVKVKKVHVGHLTLVSGSQIEQALRSAGNERLRLNQEYNAALLVGRMRFRKIVDTQLAKRDAKPVTY